MQKKSLQQLFDEYLLECEFAKKIRPETLRGYKETFATFMRLVPNASLETLTSKAMVEFFQILEQRKRIVGKGTIKVGVKKSTIATYWNRLNRFFRWLQNRQLIEANPFVGLPYPNVSYEDVKYLNKQKVERIISAIHAHSHSVFTLKRNLVMVYLLLYCGLRREELSLIQIRDIDLERKVLTVRGEISKIDRTRYIPLHSELILHLKDYLQTRRTYSSPYLILSSQKDERFTYAGLKHWVHKFNIHSGVKFHLHQFRHTFAVNFLKASNNIVKLKQLMGHKDITMTLVYLRCLPIKEMRADMENMDLDNFI